MGDDHASSSETFWLIVLGIVALIGVWVFCRRHYRLEQVNNNAALAVANYGDEEDTMTSSMLEGSEIDKDNYDAYHNLNKYNTTRSVNDNNMEISSHTKSTEVIIVDALGRAKYLPFDSKHNETKHDRSSEEDDSGSSDDTDSNRFGSIVESNASTAASGASTIEEENGVPMGFDELNNCNFVSMKQISNDDAFKWEILTNNASIVCTLRPKSENNIKHWIFNLSTREIRIIQMNESIHGWYCGDSTMLQDNNNNENDNDSNENSRITQWKINKNVLFSIKDNFNCWKSQDSSFILNDVSDNNFTKWKISDNGILPIETRVAMIFGALLATKIHSYINI